MTDERFRKLYNAARAAAVQVRSPDEGKRELGQRRLDQALNVLAMEVGEGQASMIEWASANGWPAFETVERYGG
jgi:ribosomal protein S7